MYMISFLTVNYQSHHMLLKLYNSLLEHANDIEWELIIVDNYTTDAERARLKESFEGVPNIEVVCLSENYGFGTANNRGIRFCNYEYVCLINPDIELLEGTLEALLQGINTHKKAHIVCPVLYTASGTLLESTYKYPTIIDKMRRKLLNIYPILEEITEDRVVDWAQGSMLFMRKDDYINTYNGFDERYFMFFEDTDLCKRVAKNGYEVWQIADSKALHSEKRVSRNGSFIKDIRDKLFWVHIKSALQYYIKWR